MSQQILIFENDQEWHHMLKEIVEAMGYDSHVVNRATEAFKILDDYVISPGDPGRRGPVFWISSSATFTRGRA